MAAATIVFSISKALPEALSALAESANGARQAVERGLCLLDGAGNVIGFDLERFVTSRTGQGWAELQPSDELLELVAAARALDAGGGLVQRSAAA